MEVTSLKLVVLTVILVGSIALIVVLLTDKDDEPIGLFAVEEDTAECGSISILSGISKRPKRMIGGSASDPGYHPWAVAIVDQADSKSPFCTGSLISKNRVLTAAHCFVSKTGALIHRDINNVIAKLGSPDLSFQSDEHQEIRVSQVYVHKKFDRQTSFFSYDVAILELESAADLRFFVRTICLPSPDDKDTIEQMREAADDVVVGGWGRTGDLSTSSEIYKWAPQVILNTDQCRDSLHNLGRTRFEYNIMTCAKAGQSHHKPGHPCKGDSGAALAVALNTTNGVRYYQRGVMSFLDDDCKNNVSFYADLLGTESRDGRRKFFPMLSGIKKLPKPGLYYKIIDEE